MAPVTTDEQAKKLELIQQLLNKAANTPYPAEAETFQEHAERLMARYSIDAAMLDAEAAKQGKPREKMLESRYEVSGVYRLAYVRGLSYIATAFHLQVLEQTWRNRTTLYLIGAETDVAQARRMFDSVMQQMETAMASWWLNYPPRQWIVDRATKQAEKRQFQLTFLTTVGTRLRKMYGEEGTGAELVLADRKARAEEYASELYPDTRTVKQRALRAGSSYASAAGRAAGERANVGAGDLSAKQAAAVGA